MRTLTIFLLVFFPFLSESQVFTTIKDASYLSKSELVSCLEAGCDYLIVSRLAVKIELARVFNSHIEDKAIGWEWLPAFRGENSGVPSFIKTERVNEAKAGDIGDSLARSLLVGYWDDKARKFSYTKMKLSENEKLLVYEGWIVFSLTRGVPIIDEDRVLYKTEEYKKTSRRRVGNMIIEGNDTIINEDVNLQDMFGGMYDQNGIFKFPGSQSGTKKK